MKRTLALAWLESQPWAVDSTTLQTMASMAERLTSDELSGLPMALAARDGKKAGDTMQKRGKVAVIPVRGVIARYANLFQQICGGTSIQLLSRDYQLAMSDPAVKAIVLDIDSPGGDVNGVHELAEMLFEGRKKKKTVAYVGALGCSAAYWLASAANEVVIDATARVGSIGVVMALRRHSDNNQIEVVSSQSPKKRLDPASGAGRSEYQGMMDAMAAVFVARIARNMKVSESTVLNKFGRGSVLVGQSAVNNKMAHRLGSLEGVIKELGGV